jgi:hypothetical protein
MPVATAASGDSHVETGTLPGGPVAVAVHAGPYGPCRLEDGGVLAAPTVSQRSKVKGQR